MSNRNIRRQREKTRAAQQNAERQPDPDLSLIDLDGPVDPLDRIANIVPSKGDRRPSSASIEVRQQRYSGPLPHPDLFRQYGEVIPDAPERILRVFEDDSRHVREIQRDVLDAQKRDNQRVHWMAYSLILGGFAISLVFALMKEPYLAGTVLGTTLLGTIGGLVNSLRSSSSSDGKQSNEKPKK